MNSEKEKPLFLKLKANILQEIQNGTYKKGEKIPTEAELTKKYSTSITTVRKAIQDLCVEKILVKHQGRGTFVQNVIRIGIVTPYPGDSWTSMWEGLQNASNEYSFFIKFYPYAWAETESFMEKLELCLDESSGVIVFPPYHSDRRVAEKFFELQLNKYPTVFIEKPAHPALRMFNFVQMDYQKGFESMIAKLQQQYKHIGVLADPAHASYSGLIQACENCGIDHSYIKEEATMDKTNIPGMVDLLLAMNPPPEVIVCITSIATITVFAYLRSKKMNIPEDIALAGAGNIASLSNLLLPMKALDFPRKEMGEEAGKLMSEILKNPASEHVITLEPKVVDLK